MAKHIQHYFTKEETFILDCIKGKPSMLINDLSIEQAHLFALRNGLSPYLFSLIKNKKQDIPTPLFALLKTDFINSFIRTTQIQNVWKEIQRLFSDHKLPYIPLKGSFLANHVYTDACIRPMSDLDILLLNGDTEKAFDLLLTKGGQTSNEEQAHHDKKTGHHLPGIVYKGVLIELHTSLFPLDVNYQIPNAYIEKNLIQYEGINTLPPMLNLCYFCLHAYFTMKRGGIRLSWFLDLVLLSQSAYFASDDTVFEDIINELGIKTPVLDLLMRAEFLFDHHFNFISSSLRVPLNETEKSNFISFIQHSEQQNTNFSYHIALERLKNTKGLRNKLVFIKSVLFKGERKSITAVSKRFFTLSKRLLSMLLNKN